MSRTVNRPSPFSMPTKHQRFSTRTFCRTFCRDGHRSILANRYQNASMPVPYPCIGGKTPYSLFIDICSCGTSASKRGNLKAHVLDKGDILESIAWEATTNQK